MSYYLSTLLLFNTFKIIMAKINDKLTVAVLMGGIGSEREVSLQSGKCVAQALQQAGMTVIVNDITPDAIEILNDRSIDVFFPALHGQFGEDGRLQQIFEDKSLIYAGSGPAASKAAFDKMISKKIFARSGVPVPKAIEFNGQIDAGQIRTKLQPVTDKYVVKPLRQGSSIGVSIVSTAQDAVEAAKQTQKQYGDCMIEEFIPGRELTVGVLCDRTLPIIEIKPKSGFYNYHAKYIDEETAYLFDTITDSSLVTLVSKAGMDCFKALGCRHFARIDFILTEQGTPYALEANTIPGFTSHSLLPKAAAKAGISISNLCKTIVEAAYSSSQAGHKMQGTKSKTKQKTKIGQPES
jgi:D-alanine-D-alanine ligase